MSSLGRKLTVLSLGFVFLMTALPLSAVATTASIPIIFVGNSPTESTNWSGYAVTGAAGSVVEAQGSWTVPTVTCGSGEVSYSADWVGIDGYNSKTVEQTGTDSDCKTGTPHYYAWYEFYPKGSKDIGTIVVSPGDVLAARVSYVNGVFKIAIQDKTTGKTYATSSAVSGAQRSSAEFIVEAPEVCALRCHLTSLSDFGTIGLGQVNTGFASTCYVQMTGGALSPLSSFGTAVAPITMVSQATPPLVKAAPSALSSDGSSFTVTWVSAGP